MSDEDLAAAQADLERIAELWPYVADVVEDSGVWRRHIAGVDPEWHRRCDVPAHRAEGWVEPCRACQVQAEREGWKPAMGRPPIRTGPVDAAVEVQLTLSDLERRAHEQILELALGPPMPLDDQAARARRLAWDLLPLARHDDELMARAARDCKAAADVLKVAVDGDQEIRMQLPCPYCRRRSLVANFTEQVIRCAGRHRCLCGHDECECTTGGRHEWSYWSGTRWHGEWGVLARLAEVVFRGEASR